MKKLIQLILVPLDSLNRHGEHDNEASDKEKHNFVVSVLNFEEEDSWSEEYCVDNQHADEAAARDIVELGFRQTDKLNENEGAD